MKATVHNAISHALIDLGVNVITHVPGYGASEVFTSYNELSQKRLPISFHEEVAYTICHGVSISGKRSAALMKAQGIAKAANSVVDSLYTQCNGGFVIFVFEDFSGAHSDNIMEAEQMLFGMSFPYLKGDSPQIYNDVIDAYNLSEEKSLPVALLIDASRINDTVEFNRKELRKTGTYTRDVLAHVVHPFFADYQYKIFTTNKLNGNIKTIIRPELPILPEGLPERYKENAKSYQSFFDVFRQYKNGIVCGDTSSSSVYCLPPYDAIDIVTYIGGSIPLAIGAYLAGNKYVWALTGDFGFIAAGHLGLLEAANRELPIKIVIFYNKQASATGGQQINKKIMLRLLAAYEPFTKHIYNPNDPIEISQVLDEVINSCELRIVLIHY